MKRSGVRRNNNAAPVASGNTPGGRGPYINPRQAMGASDDDAFWTVYLTPPPDPKARRRRLICLRISLFIVLSMCASIPIAVAIYRARIECKVDTRCEAPHQWLLRGRDGSMTLRKNNTSTLMIVAHPDDEILWGFEFLLEFGHTTHVVATSTEQGPSSPTTTQVLSDEFRSSSDLLKFRGEFLWGKDRFEGKPWKLERSVQRRIRARMCDQRWDRIVTHGWEGEYGHPQHHAVHDAVLDAMRYCCNSTGRLFVFQPDPFAGGPYSEEKERAMKSSYKSRSDIDRGWFRNWTEAVVPYGEYDTELAEWVCKEFNISGKRGMDDTCRISAVEDAGGGPAGGGRVSGASSSDSSELFGERRVFQARGRGC